MRINPIMAQCPNLATKNLTQKSIQQNISFGMIQDRKTEELTHEMMLKRVAWYDEEDKKDPSFRYKEIVEYIGKKLDYFKTSPLFTLKSTKYSDGNDALYVTMNQQEVDKHEHKNLFYEMMDRLKTAYDEIRNGDGLWDKEIQETGMLDEDGFLEILDNENDIQEFYDEMQLREQGERPEPPKSEPYTPPSDSDSDPLANDKSYQAWKLYGV